MAAGRVPRSKMEIAEARFNKRIPYFDYTPLTEQRLEQEKVTAARVAVHRAQLATAVEALQRAVDEGATLAELAQWDPVAAAEARAEFESLADLVSSQLNAARMASTTSSRAALSPTPKSKG